MKVLGGGIDIVVPVRDCNILEEVPVVHDVSPVAGHLDLHLVCTRRFCTKAHLLEELGHLMRPSALTPMKPGALFHAHDPFRGSKRRGLHSADLDALDLCPCLGHGRADDVDSNANCPFVGAGRVEKDVLRSRWSPGSARR